MLSLPTCEYSTIVQQSTFNSDDVLYRTISYDINLTKSNKFCPDETGPFARVLSFQNKVYRMIISDNCTGVNMQVNVIKVGVSPSFLS